MSADQESLNYLLYLFDSFWFDIQILKKNSNPPFASKVEDDNDELKLARISTHHDDQDDDYKSIMIMSSQQILSSGDSDNKLRSPNSGKESGEVAKEKPLEKQQEKQVSKSSENIDNKRKRRCRRKGKGRLSSKSLLELEFEEVKGFMDLGFVFSEVDKNSNLVKIIPGLQRFGNHQQDQEHSNSASLRQPAYLSQAWDIMEFGRKESLKWKISTAGVLDNEMHMKHQLRFWAHSVASAVR